jgi:prefoldin subunit 5
MPGVTIMQEKKEYTTVEVLANQVKVYKEHIAKLNDQIAQLEYQVEAYRRLATDTSHILKSLT